MTKRSLQLGDDFLARLASDIETEEDAEILGRKLGFEQAEINRFMATNRSGYHVTCAGTRSMLFAWRQKVSPSDQPDTLRKCLLDAELVALADEYLGEIKHTTDPKPIPCQPMFSFNYCLKVLKDHYKTVLCQIQRRPWDPNDFADLKHLFTDINLVKFDRSTGQFQKTPLKGSVNGIFGTQIDGQFPKRIILTAPGGHGKTCAVAKLAYDWLHQTDGSPMKGLKALFVLRLREVEESVSLGEAITSQLLGETFGVTSESIENFLEMHQESCALIFDGYDEFKGSIKSTITSLTKVLRNIRLKNCRVLVTTRPHLEGDFSQGELSRIYTKMSIEGFSSDSSLQFIRRYFQARSSSNGGRELIKYIRNNNFLESLIKVPLFCTMVCHLYEVEALSNAHSLTSLFDSINQFLLQHALAKEVPSLLPSEAKLEDILYDLGKFAFDGLRSDSKKLVFQVEDFKHYPDAYKIGIKLGILSASSIPIKHLVNRQTSKTTVEFFHKLQQEYCASIYMRRLGITRESRYIKFRSPSKLDSLLAKEVNTVAKTLELENVLCFIAGANRPACLSVFRHIANQVKDFVLYYKCRLVLRCLLEADRSYVDDCHNVASALRKCFWDGKVDLYPLTDMMMTGLERLPQVAKRAITSVALCSTNLSVTMTTRLWSCLSSFDYLYNLYLNSSSINVENGELLPPLRSVRRLETWSLQKETFDHLTRCLPAVEDVEIWIGNEDNLDQALEWITCSLGEMGHTLRWIEINGLLNTNGSTVSKSTCEKFGRTIQQKAIQLETLCMVEIKMEYAEGLNDIVKCCKGIRSFKRLRFECDIHTNKETVYNILDGIGTRVESLGGLQKRRCNCMGIIVKQPGDSILNWKVRR
nr:uncharacterized protein LOC129261437 [Lytechinus pictus]